MHVARDFKSLVSANSTTPACVLMLSPRARRVKDGTGQKALDIIALNGYNILI